MKDVLEKGPYRSTSIYASCQAVTSSGHLIVTAAKEEVRRSIIKGKNVCTGRMDRLVGSNERRTRQSALWVPYERQLDVYLCLF